MPSPHEGSSAPKGCDSGWVGIRSGRINSVPNTWVSPCGRATTAAGLRPRGRRSSHQCESCSQSDVIKRVRAWMRARGSCMLPLRGVDQVCTASASGLSDRSDGSSAVTGRICILSGSWQLSQNSAVVNLAGRELNVHSDCASRPRRYRCG